MTLCGAQAPMPWPAAVCGYLLVVNCTLAALANALPGAMLLDDLHGNQRWAAEDGMWAALRGSVRPVSDASFMLLYTLSDGSVASQHALNIAVHAVSACLLLALLMRTLPGVHRHRDSQRGHPAKASCSPAGPALVITLLWAVHPLQTQSVTYLSQRCESLAGMWLLAVLYAARRSAMPRAGQWWGVAAVIACLAGMATKETMVAAPLLVALYDRTFIHDTWRSAWARRRRLYVALLCTWAVIPALWLLNPPGAAAGTAGFGYGAVSPWQYAVSQVEVLLHYGRLSVWPWPLCLDYAWPVASVDVGLLSAIPAWAAGLGLWLWSRRRCPPLAFAGWWCVLILAPTSSFMPIQDLAAEHRMYLPLAAVLAVVVVAAHRLLHRLAAAAAVLRPVRMTVLATGGAVIALGVCAAQRNRDYHSAERMWETVLTVRPRNGRAHCNLGNIRLQSGRRQQAAEHFAAAVILAPRLPMAHNGLATALYQAGRFMPALDHSLEALRLRDDFVEAATNAGNALAALNRLDAAVCMYHRALAMNPRYAPAHNNLGIALAMAHDPRAAAAHFDAACRLDPHLSAACHNLALHREDGP